MGSGEVASAAGAGIVTTIVGHPLDTIKVHLQTNRGGLNTTRDAATELVHQRALFRGILPPLANAIAMNTVMFSVFATIKKSIVVGDNENSNSNNNSKTSSLTSSQTASLEAGLASGFATAFLSTPTDLVKIQMQLKGGSSSSSLHVLKSMPGVSHLYRGHLANLGREGAFTMVYLGFYDQCHPQDFWQIAAASSLTGGLAWVVSYPLDTLKTVVQSSTLSYQQAMKQIGNLSGYYRGCGASTGRAVLVTSLRMIVYESILSITGD